MHARSSLVGAATESCTPQAAWVVGAVGVALPGLRTAASRLTRAGATTDVEADLIAGFLAALPALDLGQPRVCARLCNAAYVAARAAARSTAPATSGEGNFAPASALPPRPWGHLDFVLARAVAQRVISAADAELIAVTRLEDVPLRVYAERIGEPRWAVYKRRTRAEARLVAVIHAGQLADEDREVIADATLTTARAAPRQLTRRAEAAPSVQPEGAAGHLWMRTTRSRPSLDRAPLTALTPRPAADSKGGRPRRSRTPDRLPAEHASPR